MVSCNLILLFHCEWPYQGFPLRQSGSKNNNLTEHHAQIRTKRWVSDPHLGIKDGNPLHGYHLNHWYNYVEPLVRKQNRAGCYVCSLMPKASHQPTLTVIPIHHNKSLCVAQFSAWGYCTRFYYNYSVPTQNSSTSPQPVCGTWYYHLPTYKLISQRSNSRNCTLSIRKVPSMFLSSRNQAYGKSVP